MACEGQDTGASKENQGWLKLILVKTVVVRRLSQKTMIANNHSLLKREFADKTP